MLPTFLGIGAFKAGTTTLHRLLADHPDVHAFPGKEVDFFSVDSRWTRGRSWYEKQFADAGDAAAVGEVSPSYSLYPTFPWVAERVASLVPHVQLIYLVRHPLERMRSMYRHMVASGAEHLPFAVAVMARAEYLDASRYGWQLQRWLDWFPRQQLLVMDTALLKRAPATACRLLYTHLGVDPSFVPRDPGVRLHRTRDRLDRSGRALPDTTMPDTVARWLAERLAEDQDRLRALLGPTTPSWPLANGGAIQ